MMLARWLNTVEWVLNDWPRIDLRAFGPGLLREVVPILELASIDSMRGGSTQPRNQQETAWPSDSF